MAKLPALAVARGDLDLVAEPRCDIFATRGNKADANWDDRDPNMAMDTKKVCLRARV